MVEPLSTWGRVRVIHPTPSTASYRTCAPASFTGTYPSTAAPRAIALDIGLGRRDEPAVVDRLTEAWLYSDGPRAVDAF